MSDPGRLAEIKARLASTLPAEGKPFGEFLSREALFTDLDWLIGEVERRGGLLTRLEWAGGTYCDEAACPACGRSWQYPHAADCWLAAELHSGNAEAAAPKDGGS